MTREEIFHAAIEIPPGAERDRFLVGSCGGDTDLLNEVESLLKSHDTAGDFLDEPIVSLTSEPTSISPSSLSSHGTPRLATGTLLGRYRVEGWLGSGGMGEVYLARDSQLNRDVAIKVLSPSQAADQTWLRRLHREARAAGAVNHPGILTIYEIGSSDGVDFIASEFVDGQNLRQAMRNAPISLRRTIEIGLQVSSALEAAHSAGVIHRDLKPENVMVRMDGLVKVLDFGLARAPESVFPVADGSQVQASISGLIAGTLSYMSPEQARGLRVDHRSDLFSLGTLMFEMLTGRLPFSGKTPSDILVAVLEHAPASIVPTSEGLQQVPHRLQSLILKLLAKEPEQRFARAADVEAKLKVIRNELPLAGLEGLNASPSRPEQPASRPEPTPKIAVARTDRVTSATPPGAAHPPSANDSTRPPDVRYCLSSDINIAYQVFGSGDIDIVFVMGWVSHLEWFWKDPSFAMFLRELGRFARVILFDKRGTGLSDRVPVHQLPTLEQRMDDVRAVMEAVDSQRAVLCGVSEGGPLCAMFAATYPEKTIALIMIGSYARRLWAEDYPWGVREEDRAHFLDEIRRNWGGPVGIEDRAPSRVDDEAFREWWATYLRMGASPGAALALTQMNAQIDIRPLLPLIKVPTLVIHRAADRCLKVEEGRYLAEHIPGAEFCELPGEDHLPFVGNQQEITQKIGSFLTGSLHMPHIERVLATVLCGRLQQQRLTERAGENSSELLLRVCASVREECQLFRVSRLIFSGNTFLATFDGPSRAIRAALGILRAAHRHGFGFYGGVHLGECDVSESSIGGIAAVIARQLAEAAPIQNLLISAAVTDLVAGSGLQFIPWSREILPDSLRHLRLFTVPR